MSFDLTVVQYLVTGMAVGFFVSIGYICGASPLNRAQVEEVYRECALGMLASIFLWPIFIPLLAVLTAVYSIRFWRD